MPQHFAAPLWWEATGAAPQLDHQATIAVILFVLSLTADPGLLAELAESVEECRPRAQA